MVELDEDTLQYVDTLDKRNISMTETGVWSADNHGVANSCYGFPGAALLRYHCSRSRIIVWLIQPSSTTTILPHLPHKQSAHHTKTM